MESRCIAFAMTAQFGWSRLYCRVGGWDDKNMFGELDDFHRESRGAGGAPQGALLWLEGDDVILVSHRKLPKLCELPDDPKDNSETDIPRERLLEESALLK